MISLFRSIFGKSSRRSSALDLYRGMVEAARAEVFYRDLEVQDTLDGRFDMILLHLFLISEALQSVKPSWSAGLLRDLQEILVQDMDRSLREMGVGDMSVGKKVQAMGEAWFGRLKAYHSALAEDAASPAFEDALTRNVFGGVAPQDAARKLALYCKDALTGLIEIQSGQREELDVLALCGAFDQARASVFQKGTVS